MPPPNSSSDSQHSAELLAKACGFRSAEALSSLSGIPLERLEAIAAWRVHPSAVEMGCLLVSLDMNYAALPDDDPLKIANRDVERLPRELVRAAFAKLFADIKSEDTDALLARLEAAVGEGNSRG